jgi:hypothetical protein
MGWKRLTDIFVTAVQNGLVSPAVLTDSSERLDYPESKLLALLLLVNHDIFDVAHAAQPTLELPLHNHRSHSDDLVASLVHNNEGIIGPWAGAQRLEVCDPGCFTWIWSGAQGGE